MDILEISEGHASGVAKQLGCTETVTEITTVTTTRGGQMVTGGHSVLAPEAAIIRQRAPITASRTVVINRYQAGSVITSDCTDSVQSSRAHRSFAPMSSDAQQADLNSIVTDREREKKDMQELNERFATYIEKVRFLEAQNRKLSEELQKLRDSWGKETANVRALYETELAQVRRLLKASDSYKVTMEVRVTSLEDQLNELQILLDEANRLHVSDRETIDKLNQQVADYDGEISLLRRRVGSFDDERSRDQAEIKRLRQDVARLRNDLDTGTQNHINAEFAAQSLREELEFLRIQHDSELKELAALAYRDTTGENREYWKSEMAQALRDIQREYDNKLEIVRGEVESQYSMKVREARTTNTRDNMELKHLKKENKRIKSQIEGARNRIPELEVCNSHLIRQLAEMSSEMEEFQRNSDLEKMQLRTELSHCNATMADHPNELQTLRDAKLSLELEILAYRKLLEGEEIRINHADQNCVEGSSSSVRRTTRTVVGTTRIEVGSSQQHEQGAHRMAMQMGGLMTDRTSAKCTTKGCLDIQEVDDMGRFIVLEFIDKSNEIEDLSGWTLEQSVDNGRQIIRFDFTKGTFMTGRNSSRTFKIWANGLLPTDSDDLELTEDAGEWAAYNLCRECIVTVLSNKDGDVMATHVFTTAGSSD